MIPYQQTEHARQMRDLHARLAPVETGVNLLNRAVVLFGDDEEIQDLLTEVCALAAKRLAAFDAEIAVLDGGVAQQVAA